MSAPPPPVETARKSFWRRRVLDPVLEQLRQGTSPEKIALSMALGLVISLFPILGTTTLLCFLAALWLRLNQALIQLVNYLAYPLQLCLLPVFVRLGERITGAEPVSFSLSRLTAAFRASPAQFLKEFGITGVHAVVGWLVVAPPVLALLYLVLARLLRQVRRPQPALSP